MATLEQWVAGARPRTLPAAFAPVIAGTALAWSETGRFDPGPAFGALAGAYRRRFGETPSATRQRAHR